MMDTKKSVWSLAIAVTIFLSSADANVTFSRSSISVHENHNAALDLNVTMNCSSYDCANYSCSINSSEDHFVMNGLVIQKKMCNDTYCNSCSSPGCLNGGKIHVIEVTCEYKYNDSRDSPISGNFTVNVAEAEPPTFEYSKGPSIEIPRNSSVGDVINQLNVTKLLDDDANDVDKATFRMNKGPEKSYEKNTEDLFALDEDSGEVKVNKDLKNEYSFNFTMNLCVYDRRNRTDCKNLTIKLWACFQKPNCKNETNLHLHDTYGTFTNGHGGDSNRLYTMQSLPPSGHFTYFRREWYSLNWSFHTNDLTASEINSTTGEIYITSNISIWPAWPTKDFTQVVRVDNSESCEPTFCYIRTRVHYTNWPIEICMNLNSSLHEDEDEEKRIFDIITCDYNKPTEDNVTCEITEWSPREDRLFELRDDGRHAFNSYSIYKLACSKPDCGFKHEKPIPYYCNTSTGCLTHNRTQQYIITIQCKDAYNSSDTLNLTFDVLKNKAPVYQNLPTNISLNRQRVSHLDNIFEIIYSDEENEDLRFEYEYTDEETGLSTTYFLGDPVGNSSNNKANITMTTYLWDKEVNKTYKIQICGHDRRNEICEDFTVHIEEYCSESPECTDRTYPTNTELQVGSELFDISSLVGGGTFTDLSYDISSQHGSLFSVDSISGRVTTTAKFAEVFDYNVYSIIAFVYNNGSCNYGTCQLTVNVTAINYEVNITNLPETISVSEDLAADEIIFMVDADDKNENDPYTCEIVNTNSVEPFYLERIPPENGEYFVKNRAKGVLSSATTTYSLSIECTDSHNGSDAEVLTITVTLNQAPAFTNFIPDRTQNLSADPMNFKVGDILYTVSATDNEGDDVMFTCTIPNSQVPYECESEATNVNLKIRRDLRLDDDNGRTYSAQICVRDEKHANQCGTIEVTFTRLKTRPEITNLPDTKTFTEDTSIGATLFEPNVTDPDAGESHTYSVTTKPISESSMFNLNTSSGVLTLKQSLNYESIKSYLLTYTVRDDYLECLTDKTLKIDVINVNEGTTINASPNSISFYENMAAGADLSGPDFSCSDEDGDDTSYEIVNGVNKDYFSINSKSGEITLVKEWDLESSDALPTSTTLTISCKDPGGLNSTTDITINIEDANDKPPSLNIVTGSSPITVNCSTYLYSDLMSFSATDSDFTDDNDFEFSMLGSGIGFKYFRMVKTGPSTATLKLKENLPYRNDKTFSISVKVSDGEPSPLFHGLTVQVNYTICDPDDKRVKEGARCLTCTRLGRTLIAVICIEVVICAGFVLHVLFSCHLAKKNRVNILKGKNIQSVNVKKEIRSNKMGRSRNARARFTRSNETKKPESEDRTRHEESDSGTSSSSSDSDDDHVTRRSDIHRNRFALRHRGDGLEATTSGGLPSPVYSNRVTSAGNRSIASVGGIEARFYV